MNDPHQPTRSNFWPALALLAVSVALSVILCLPILNTPLVSDDWVLLDALVQKGIWGAWGGGGHEMLGFFRPLMTLTLWVNFKIGGLNPLGYHLFNAVIHGIAAWLVLIIVTQLFSKEAARKRPSALIGIVAWFLFLVHPSHGEPVAWVSSRPDLMACALALASLAMWIDASKHPGSVSKSIMSRLLFAAALFAKESAVVLPLIVFAYEMIFAIRNNDRSRFAQALRRTWPLFLILAGFLMIRAAALGHTVGGYGSSRILAMNPVFWARNLIVATLRSLLPAIPSPGFDGWARMAYAAAAVLVAVGVSVGLVVGMVHGNDGKNRNDESCGTRVAIFCLVAFLLSILPVMNLPLSIRSSEGERFIYLPSAFMVMALALAIGRNYKANASIATCLILCVYVIGFERSLSVWRDAGTLAGRLVDELEQTSANDRLEQVIVADLPDNLRGAYVFRNGFIEAARLNGITESRIKTIRVQSTKPIDTTANIRLEAEIDP